MSTYLFAGASSAIAQATRQVLQAQGHRVIGISRATDLAGYDECFTVSDYNSVYPTMTEEFDGLVYFPGTIQLKPFARLTAQDFQTDYSIHALGAVQFVQAYIKNIKQGSIVFISSVAAGTGMPFHSSVSMAKAALEGLTVALAAELAPSIRVNCVAPSLTDTPLGNKFISTPEKLEQMEKRNPLRKVGRPEDIAASLVFLLSPASAWITGSVLPIDGGMKAIKN
jgi:NAD(P)-dependent dehydrogenase (short-subunit alcohol dehydrogenase family)